MKFRLFPLLFCLLLAPTMFLFAQENPLPITEYDIPTSDTNEGDPSSAAGNQRINTNTDSFTSLTRISTSDSEKQFVTITNEKGQVIWQSFVCKNEYFDIRMLGLPKGNYLLTITSRKAVIKELIRID